MSVMQACRYAPFARQYSCAFSAAVLASVLLIHTLRALMYAFMDQVLLLSPYTAGILAAGLGAGLGWVAPFHRRTLAVVAHGVVATIAATSVRGVASVEAWTLPAVRPDHVMGVVIAGLCLLALTTALRSRTGWQRQGASVALVAFTSIVGLLSGSGELGLATGAAIVGVVALAAPDPPLAIPSRARVGRGPLNVPRHSSPRLP
jgi:hypothetical protein